MFRPTDAGWEPPVDVFETEADVLVVIALPGVRQDDVQILMDGGELSVIGTRRWPVVRAPVRVHRVEMPHGRFERRLPLPAGFYRLEAHEFVDGCLLVKLGKLV
jgi:HSP20 family molecular chaperone IbpA